MFELVKGLTPPGLQVRHSFQTNGTLLTEEWCALIKDWEINVGVSIDGPRDLHDAYRKYRNGAGSFDRAFAGLQTLRSAGVPYHVISVLTLESLTQPERMLEFYAENAIEYVCFNIEEQEGTHGESKLVRNKGADALYQSFLTRFIELALQHKHAIRIREVEDCIRAIGEHGSTPRNGQTEPFHIVSVDCGGNLSTFSPELLSMQHELYGSFCFGNLVQDGFDEISARIQKSRLYSDIQAGIRQCNQSCAYYGLCGGGSPSNKIYENGSAASTETVYCRTFMRAIDVVLDLTERLPQDLRAAWIANAKQEHGITRGGRRASAE